MSFLQRAARGRAPVASSLLCAGLLSLAAPWPGRWLSEDRLKHFFASFFVTSVTASAARAASAGVETSMGIGIAAATATGVWKEVRDARGEGDPSAGDLIWDAAGIAAGAAIIRQVR